MTPIFCCGFECGVIGAQSSTLGEHWVSGTATAPTISTSTVLSGARSMRCNPTAATRFANTAAVFGTATRQVGRIYIQFATLPSADTSLVCYDAVGSGPSVRFKQSDSKIYASVGSTFGATGVLVATGQWYRIDWDFNVNTSGADFADIQVDGVACGQATATGVSATSTTCTVGIRSVSTGDVFFDDFVVSVTAADYPIGAGYVNHFIPTSDGTHNVAGANDFERSATGTDIDNTTTTAFQLIDDVPMKSGVVSEYINLIAPPNATDYVEVVFGPASGISTPTAAPRAVEVICAYASATAGTNNLRLALNDNGTTDDTLNTTTGPGTTATYARKHYATGPAGAWTVTAGAGNFNNIRMRCLTNDAAPDPWWASAMIEAEFAPVTGRTTKNTRSWPLGTEIGMNWRSGGV